jgi:hypothetical protein
MLMRDLSELNINEGGRPVRRAPPTQAMIDAFQKRFGVTLPPSLLSLLRHSNGGHPELNVVPERGWAIDRFYFLDDDRYSELGLWKAMEHWRPILGDDALPIATDGGGNQFFLDLAATPPSVKGCVHDERFAIVEIARSLEAMLDALAADPDAV